MALVTTAGSATADSYSTVAEVEIYLAARDPFPTQDEYTTWLALGTDAKEWRLKIATRMIDSLRFRGVKSCLAQSLAFPRLFIGDDLYPKKAVDYAARRRLVTWAADEDRALVTSDARDDRCDDWDELTDLATALGVSAPTVPDAIKQAQAEIAFQVVHCHLLTLEAMEEGATGVNSLSVGPLSVGFSSSAPQVAGYSLFAASDLNAQSLVVFLLKPYLAGKLTGVLI